MRCPAFLEGSGNQVRIPLRVLEPGRVRSAADAFATGQRAGIGGWWAVSEDVLQQSKVFWFSEMLGSTSLPS
jgi:hypothetical protein